ncbi:MAG TPA: CopD family protein, partial [Gemmatimonadaceae bacterium]|nr:CopD family protein [Gemmatimonadaceae bacterium]
LIAPAGHAGAQPGSWGDLHLAADVIHLLAAGAWLGGLPALAMLLDAARRNTDALAVTATRTTARFSWLGIICVGLLIASGVVNAWFLLSGPADLVTSTYGRVLALKIGLFAAMLVLAAINRFRLAPRLPDAQATRRLQQNSIAESCLGLGVLVLAAVLGTLEPTAHHHRHTSIPTEAAFVHIHTNIVMADVTINPGRVGSVQATIHLAKEDFSNFSARAVRFELNPPDADVANITRDARDDGDSVWRVDGFELPRPGIWTIRLSVAPQQGAIVLLDAPIVIAP